MSAYTTIFTIKSELGISDNSQDVRLQALIVQASGLIDGYCGRAFMRGAHIEKIKGYGAGSCLSIKNTPIISITSIALDDEIIDASNYAIESEDAGLISGDFVDTAPVCYSITGMTHMAGRQQRRYNVAYIGGYLLPDDANRNLPYEIERACIDLVRGGYYAQGRDVSIKSESTDGVGSITYAGNAVMGVENVRGLLASHRAGGLL
jgi:hypothetical protein